MVYSCSFRNNKSILSYDSNGVGFISLNDKLYILYIEYPYNKKIIQIKSYGAYWKLNENSAILWHKRLRHISKQRIQTLMSECILGSLDLLDFQVYIKCIKNKSTNKKNLHAKRVKNVLELVHTDI